MQAHCSLLDRDFHTPSLVCSRSPFLLTTSEFCHVKALSFLSVHLVCSIASRFYSKKPELHSRLNNLAKSLAFSVPERGYKSVEVCPPIRLTLNFSPDALRKIVQAYMLLSLWGCGPVERYEQDKTWMLLGMGLRYG